MLLIITGIILLISEAFIPLFGILGLTGLALVITGSLLSFNESLIHYGWGTLFGVSVLIALLIGGGTLTALKAYRKKTQTGHEGLIGKQARVLDWGGKQGRVFVDGENWHAVSRTSLTLERDDMVDIIAMESLTLTVAKLVPPPNPAPQKKKDI